MSLAPIGGSTGAAAVTAGGENRIDGTQPGPKEAAGDRSWREIWRGLDYPKDLRDLGQSGAGSAALPELLRYQIQAGQHHLKVELVAKVAEGLMASVRRLQNTN